MERVPVPLTPLAAAAHRRDREAFARDVQYYLGLSPKQLPSRYFYDPLGSCLFEAICRLPWYEITRAERRLLLAHAGAVGRVLRPRATLVELGCGSGEKLAALVQDLALSPSDISLHLIDVSSTALALSARALDGLCASVTSHQATYEEGLDRMADLARGAGTTLVLFLGSNIGNFDPPAADALLRRIRGALISGDVLLLGADLVKPERELLLAYDDPLGVTAAFNKNLLVRINRELDGNFDLEMFDHRAIWNPVASRVEMHLVSRGPQVTRIPVAEIAARFEARECIWTESSYKYQPDEIVGIVTPTGFLLVDQWIDLAARFALTLFAAA